MTQAMYTIIFILMLYSEASKSCCGIPDVFVPLSSCWTGPHAMTVVFWSCMVLRAKAEHFDDRSHHLVFIYYH